MNEENKIILYQNDNEITRVSVRFAEEDLWLTQNQLAEIYSTTQQNISQHVDNIYNDGELAKEATNKKFLLVRQEGNRQVKRNIDHYNLDMIIALGYRIQSQVAKFEKLLGGVEVEALNFSKKSLNLRILNPFQGLIYESVRGFTL